MDLFKSQYKYCKYLKILYTRVSEKLAYVESADLDQTGPEVSTQFAIPLCIFFK